MSYNVHWSGRAENELAEIWLEASDRLQVTNASLQLELKLANDPLGVGESRESEIRRILVEPPLVILFSIVPDESLVVVTRVRVWGNLS